MDSIGSALPHRHFVCDDWIMVYQLIRNSNNFEPMNGLNAAAWIAKKKVVVQCSRLLMLK